MENTRGLSTADADFVTDHLLVGGDLDTQDNELAVRQLSELVEAGLTHVVDARIEWSDEDWVSQLAPAIGYLHHGIDDAGQRVPGNGSTPAVDFALTAIEQGGTVLTHCHMGVNRGPSLGFAVLLAQGWDPIGALDTIRAARPIAWVAYAEDALRWHHERRSSPAGELERDQKRLAQWRAENDLDLAEVIRQRRGWSSSERSERTDETDQGY